MAQVLHAKALFECQGDEESELSFLEGDILVNVKETSEEGWLHGRLKRTGEEGLFPDNYVELVYIEATTPPATAAPPTLPARSPSTSVKSTSSIANQTKVGTPKTLAPNPTQTATPTLPTRPSQVSTPAATSPSASIGSAKAGLRSVEKTNGGGTSGGPATVALPGLGPRPMVGSISRDDSSTQSTRGPPSLPRRSNTIHGGDAGTPEKASSSPVLSVRERMANLSMTNQRLTAPGSPSGPLQSPLQLPARPSVGTPITPKPNPAARSPLSSASRPALPPRTLTESPVDNGMARSGYSAMPKKVSPSSFQVQDAAVPVPKLTTFSRPRSARTSKSGGSSGGSSLSLTESGKGSLTTTTPLAAAAGNRTDPMSSAGPPKLPARTTPASKSSSPSSVSTGLGAQSSDSGPVRFSPGAIRSNNAVAANSALPTISRNAQPLQLPSRPSPGSPNITGTNNNNTNTNTSLNSGLARSATAGHHNTLHNDNDSNSNKGPTSPFGVKLNSVSGGSRPMTSYSAPTAAVIASSTLNDAIEKAPPLPARANTIAPSSTATTNMSSSSSNEQRYMLSTPRSLKDDHSSELHSSSPLQDRDRERIVNTVGGNSHSSASSSSSWASGHGSPLKGSAVGTRVAMMPPAQIPDMTPSEDVGIKKNVRMRYETLFRASTSGEFMDGATVHAIYVKSRLDSKTLAQIWDLVDVDNAGRLSRAQFCMGLYLIDERLASGLIPLEVSDELWVSVML